LRLNPQVKVVKFGGSVITFKERPLTIRSDVIKYLVNEISQVIKGFEDLKLILVHGGGSFGHYVVKECLKTSNVLTDECFSKTTYTMTVLNVIIVRELINAGLQAISLPPHAVFLRDNNGVLRYDLRVINECISRGIIPVLYGDVIISGNSYEVLSGDTISWILAKELSADELIFLTDVNGVYDKDPKKHPEARLIKEIRSADLSNISISQSEYDVTGGMVRKLMEGLHYGVVGVKVKVINGLIQGNLYKSLCGEEFIGTVIMY